MKNATTFYILLTIFLSTYAIRSGSLRKKRFGYVTRANIFQASPCKITSAKLFASNVDTDYMGSMNSILRKINGAQPFFFPSEVAPTSISTPNPPVPTEQVSQVVPAFDRVVQNIITSTLPTPPVPPPPLPTIDPVDNIMLQLSYYANEIASHIFTIPMVTAVVFALVVSGVGVDDSLVGNPYEGIQGARYDIVKSNMFYGSRPLYVFRRMMRLVSLTAAFNWHLFLDWRTGNLQTNEKIRAKEALDLCTKLGPTFIKLGQALSIRTDLINEAYATELQKLQDAVPPFNTTYAKEIICREIGIKDLKEKFSYVSEQPIAAASIGQVFRGTLLDGTDVAIKVQRPRILDDIAVDLYLLRLITPLQVRATNLVQGIAADQFDIDGGLAFVDEWGKGLVAEADYCLEAKNAQQFITAMESRGLTALMAPGVVAELSGSKVLVTKWINGTRLDRDASADVPRLCAVAVNAYLTMLLDTGVLHCDPHPGNLLRTTDGKLCILDWGMTITVPPDLQYGLLEFIAHMNAEDYDSLPEDFVKIGATPADKIEEVRKSGMAEGFAFAMKQLSKGGGPAKIRDRLRDEFKGKFGDDLSDDELSVKARQQMMANFEEQLRSEGVDVVSGVTNVMETLSKRNREFFKLPTYMLYVSRAFSVLEGIGLSVDENYSILQECYPYMAKRLMTDDSPRSRKALRDMLVTNEGLIASDKLIEFSSGFTNYTASTVSLSSESEKEGEGMKVAQMALIDLLLDKKGNVMQELLLEGAANITDSLIRDSIERAYQSPTGQLVQTALRVPKSVVQALVPESLQVLTLPFTLPYDLSKVLLKLSEKDDLDNASLQSLQNIWNTTVEPRLRERLNEIRAGDPSGQNSINVNTVLEALREANLGEKAPVAVSLGRKLTATLLTRAATRLKSTASKVRDDHDVPATSTVSANLNNTSNTSIVPLNKLSSPPYNSVSNNSNNKNTSHNKGNNSSSNSDDLDPLEKLMAERIGAMSANTANRLASILEDS